MLKSSTSAKTVHRFRNVLLDIEPVIWRRIQVLEDYSFWGLHVALSLLFYEVGTVSEHEYDFGDGWVHEINHEGILMCGPGATYPRCIDGARACPPEDCAGPPGYEDLFRESEYMPETAMSPLLGFEELLMFVLLVDDKFGDDGKTYTYYPFTIKIAKFGYTLASFITEELAEYFRSFMKLEDEYNVVDIMQVDREKISNCRYVCVFRTKKEVQRLLDTTRKRRHPNRLIELSSIRSDTD
jgi:hypothetical protein